MKINNRLILIVVSSLFLLSSLLASCGNGEEAQETPTPTGQNGGNSEGHSFMWEVSSDISTIYILGSIHVADSDIYPLDSTIENAFQQSDYLVVEVDTTKIDQNYLEQLIIQKGVYLGSDSLQNHLPEDLYYRLDQEFQALGLDISMFDPYKPWYVSTSLESLKMEEYGYTSDNSVDLYFINQAIENNIPIIELETADFQIELLSSIPYDITILSLQEFVNTPDIEEELNLMFDAWENGDVDGMRVFTFQALDEYPELAPLYEVLFDDRNIQMTDKIEGFLKDEDTYFVTVGAGHLVGEKGIISLLEERGYQVEQI